MIGNGFGRARILGRRDSTNASLSQPNAKRKRELVTSSSQSQQTLTLGDFHTLLSSTFDVLKTVTLKPTLGNKKNKTKITKICEKYTKSQTLQNKMQQTKMKQKKKLKFIDLSLNI